MDHEALAFERLHLLAKRGYVPSLGKATASGGMLLTGPRKAPDLILHPSGKIDRIERRRGAESGTALMIPQDDQQNFYRFLETLPQRKPPRHWRRRFKVLSLILFLWLFSIFITISIVEGG